MAGCELITPVEACAAQGADEALCFTLTSFVLDLDTKYG